MRWQPIPGPPAPRVFRASGLPRLRQRSWASGGSRRRQLLAALLAVAAGLVLLGSRPSSEPPVAVPPGPRPEPGQVAAPVRLADPALAQLLQPGAVVDILSVPEAEPGRTARAVTAAEAVTVLDVPGSGGSSEGALVVVAVTPPQARALAGAQATGRLSVTLIG